MLSRRIESLASVVSGRGENRGTVRSVHAATGSGVFSRGIVRALGQSGLSPCFLTFHREAGRWLRWIGLRRLSRLFAGLGLRSAGLGRRFSRRPLRLPGWRSGRPDLDRGLRLLPAAFWTERRGGGTWRAGALGLRRLWA